MKSGILLFVFVYSFLFLNLSRSQTSTAGTTEVFCPDGYAVKVDASHYVGCENFDEYHLNHAKGITRTDLYLK